MNKKEIISKEIVHQFLTDAWTFVVPQGLKNTPLDSLKVADWEILSSAIEILFNSPTYRAYSLETVTGESFYNLYHSGAGKKNRSIFSLCLYLLIQKGLLDTTEHEYFEDFNKHKFYFLQRLLDIYIDEFQEEELVKDHENSDSESNLVEDIKIEKEEIKNRFPHFLFGFLIMIVLSAYAVNLLYKNESRQKVQPNDSRIKFYVSNSTNYGIAPTDITFSYDISGIDYDSAFIEFGDKHNPIKFPLESSMGQIPHTFTHPQGRDVSITVDSVKKVIFVPIYSYGWFSKLGEWYLPESKFKINGMLHIAELYVPPQIIKEGEYYVSIQNLSDFGCVSDSLIFETRVKNPQEEGGISCFDVSIDLNGLLPNFERGILSFNLVKPKCTRFAHITAGKTEYPNKMSPNLLDNLGVDVSSWVVIKVRTGGNRVKIYVNNKVLYDLPYSGKIGQLKFIQIFFKGTGSVDWIKISKLNGESVYYDDFSH